MHKIYHLIKPERLGILALVIGHLLAAFYSFGYHHPDEQFQIWEWANYFAGLSKTNSYLPWEYAAQIRPWFQPMLHAGLIRFFSSIHFYDPFSLAFFFRCAYALANIVGIFWLWRAIKASAALSSWWFLVIGLLWFFPYIHVRTSSENLAGIFLTFSFAYYLRTQKYFWTGVLFGFAFLARYQIALGLVGFAFYLLYRDRKILQAHWVLLAGFLIPVGLGVLIDRIGYGNWVFTPYRYFTVNMVQGVAASYNPYPWYQYFVWIAQLNPLVSLPLFFGFLLCLVKRKWDGMISFIVSFVVIHLFITNKEYRFLFPILNLVPFLAALGFEATYRNCESTLRSKKILIPYLLISLLAFAASSLRGASLETLWLVHSVHAHLDPSRMIISNRDYADQAQTSYYTLPDHPHLIVHTREELAAALQQYPLALVFIDGSFHDPLTRSYLNLVQDQSCKLTDAALPLFIYRNLGKTPALQRLKALVLFDCSQKQEERFF